VHCQRNYYPLGRTVAYAYDGADNLDQLTDARGLSTTREIDGFGEIIEEVSPDRGTRSLWYDLSGNLTKLVDGDSVETDFAYDDANRRTAMTFPSDTAENTAFSYDATSGGNAGVGRLTGVTEASGSTSLAYDAQGRLTADAKVISPSGYTTALTAQYAHDANGRVTQITYPSGDVVNYTRTTDGLITGVTFTPSGGSPQTIASGVTYEPYGPITGLTYGNGLTLSRAYDQDYRLTNLTVAPSSGPAVISLAFGWQADGRLASVADAVGDRTPTAPTATLLQASLSSTANQVTGTTTLAGATARTLTYSPGGLLTQDVHAGGVTYGYGYNAARRLTSVTQGGTTAGSYAYDYAGRRVWRQTTGSGAAQTAYVYDEDGHLLAEHNASTGAVTREYVWIDDMPVALADIAGSTVTIGYIHTGQIDEPLKVTNQVQAVVWNGYVDAFGNGSTFSTPTLAAPLDMRLPGQSFQLETGSLSQNGWRDYDPSLGRYIEADPLGIDAGQNVYAYVDGDPLNDEDPWGLSSLSFNRDDGTITLIDHDGRVIIICRASNNPISPAKDPNSRRPYSRGIYAYKGWSPKPIDPNGPFGSHGVFHFPRPDCPGCEVHAGRANKGGPIGTKTEGCIRTTDSCMQIILNTINGGDPLTTLTVQ
jgi:RHS repeat-associated protein